MRICHNRTGSDCGIVAVANATGRSYATVRKAYGPPGSGLTIWQLKCLLDVFASAREVRIRRRVTLAEWTSRHQKGRWIVCLVAFLNCHFAAVVDGVAMNAGDDHDHALWIVDRAFTISETLPIYPQTGRIQ